MRIKLQKSLGLGLTIFVSKLSLNKIHDVKCFCVLFCCLFRIHWYIFIHRPILVRIFLVIEVQYSFKSFILQILLFFVKVVKNFEMIFGENYRVVDIVFIVFEEFGEFLNGFLVRIRLFHDFFILKIAHIFQQYFLSSSASPESFLEISQIKEFFRRPVPV